MSFGEEDGEEFEQVKVALVPVVELDVPDEFGVSGHVVVSDHAAVPPATELHPDVSSDEEVRVRGRGMRRGGVGGEGGNTWDPSLPMGRRGFRWWEKEGRVSPPVGRFVGRIYERTFNPLVPPPTYIGGWVKSGRGLCRRRRAGRRGRSPRRSWSSDRLVRVRPGLGVGVRGGAWASRRGENGGDTRCSRRDCCRDERGG